MPNDDDNSDTTGSSGDNTSDVGGNAAENQEAPVDIPKSFALGRYMSSHASRDPYFGGARNEAK